MFLAAKRQMSSKQSEVRCSGEQWLSFCSGTGGRTGGRDKAQLTPVAPAVGHIQIQIACLSICLNPLTVAANFSTVLMADT